MLTHLLLPYLCLLLGASGSTNPVDCAFRQLALRLASRNLAANPGKLAIVASGLNATDCHLIAPAGRYQTVKSHDSTSRRVFVAPNGDDSHPGTLEAPLRTLGAARSRVRSLLKEAPTGVTVELRQGTFYESLVLGPEDSGTPAAPVVWRSLPGELATLSGGTLLQCDWKKVTLQSGATAASCALPPDMPEFTSLFFNSQRLQRARWPNGDPSVPCNSAVNCARAGYTAAGAASPSLGQCAPDASKVGGQGVSVYNGDTLLSQGILSMDQSAPSLIINVSDTPFVHDAGAFRDYQAYQGGGVSCYNSSYNLPFWNAGTCNCRNFTLTDPTHPASWAQPQTGVVHMFHSSLWGGWGFNVTGYSPETPGGAPASLGISGGQQTGQQGSRSISRNQFYVENIYEELDVPGEFFVANNTLLLIPPAGQAVESAEVVAPVRARVVQFRGSGEGEWVHDVRLAGVRVTHSAPTFMADYEIPSGGDWSVHRGGAVFLDGTEDVAIQDTEVLSAGGNGIFLSNHCWRTTLHNNTVAYAGDSSILLIGSTALMNGTRGSFPAENNITNNLCYENGYFGKQTAAFFRSIAHRTLLSQNVFFNSPRSLVNYNDAFRGGDVMEENLLWGAVKETADHASFNSWDRQAWFWEESGEYRFRPETQTIRRNLILNKDYQYGSSNSDWAIDHDDASSWFEDYNNVMVYGSHKWRDGVHKWYTSNLYVTPPDSLVAQQWGVGWYSPNTNSSRFLNNTMVNFGPQSQFHYVWSLPLPSLDFQVANNRYYTPNDPNLTFHVGGRPDITSLGEWQTLCQNDLGSQISADMDVDRTIVMAEKLLGI